MVGHADGAAVGPLVGALVGAVGLNVGMLVGILVGVAVGASVGAVGVRVGAAVGDRLVQPMIASHPILSLCCGCKCICPGLQVHRKLFPENWRQSVVLLSQLCRVSSLQML